MARGSRSKDKRKAKGANKSDGEDGGSGSESDLEEYAKVRTIYALSIALLDCLVC